MTPRADHHPHGERASAGNTQSIKAADKDSFEALIAQYHPIIYKICRAYTGKEDFDDLYQEILINLWRGGKTFEGRSKLSTWLYRVALNTALTYQRNAKKHGNRVSLATLPEIPASKGGGHAPDREIDRLYQAIGKLKKEHKSIILLYLEEKSYEEIAEISGLSVSNVGVRINRIKKRLFQALNQTAHG